MAAENENGQERTELPTEKRIQKPVMKVKCYVQKKWSQLPFCSVLLVRIDVSKRYVWRRHGADYALLLYARARLYL